MKEYFISEIDIEKLYHLSNIKIKLDSMKRQHLLLTGRNGSGKTSLLLAIRKFLQAINDENLIFLLEKYPTWRKNAKIKKESATNEIQKLEAEKAYKNYTEWIEKYQDGVLIELNKYDGIEKAYKDGDVTLYR